MGSVCSIHNSKRQSFRPCTNLLTSFYIQRKGSIIAKKICFLSAERSEWKFMQISLAIASNFSHSIAFMIYCVLVIDIWAELELQSPFVYNPPTIVSVSCRPSFSLSQPSHHTLSIIRRCGNDSIEKKNAKSDQWKSSGIFLTHDNDVFIYLLKRSFGSVRVWKFYNWVRDPPSCHRDCFAISWAIGFATAKASSLIIADIQKSFFPSFSRGPEKSKKRAVCVKRGVVTLPKTAHMWSRQRAEINDISFNRVAG